VDGSLSVNIEYLTDKSRYRSVRCALLLVAGRAQQV